MCTVQYYYHALYRCTVYPESDRFESGTGTHADHWMPFGGKFKFPFFVTEKPLGSFLCKLLALTVRPGYLVYKSYPAQPLPQQTNTEK